MTVDPPGGYAIIEMSCRVPGANSPEAFWDNLAGGVESVHWFTEAELRAVGHREAVLQNPRFVPACGALTDVTDFDASFFDMTPREAATMDPQQRLFLETVHTALERAGYDTSRYDAPVGLFAGVGWNHYLLDHLVRSVHGEEDLLQYRIRNDKDFLTTFVSYKLNLRGPSFSVQTACSTSLVATHLACQSLRDYECDIAVAGGVNVNVPSAHGYVPRDGVFSPDGHCRAFDVQAQGTVPGSGAGVIVLKRLEDALRDGDRVYAVIRGTAINNDGALKAGYTAPSVDGQTEAIATAQALADVDPATVTYVETHGTGTPMGDPIEIKALTKAFRMRSSKPLDTPHCAIGSVKTNVGHLDAAAGVVSLMKTALALSHRQIPPSLHFDTPNPHIDFASSPFFVNDRLREWDASGGLRRAGVSAFGVGGTNAHVVLEEAPEAQPSGPSRPAHVLVLSAQTSTALETATDRLADHLEADAPVLADAAFTLWAGRRRFDHRRIVVAKHSEDAVKALRDRSPNVVFTDETREDQASPVFLFPGLGNHYLQMGKGLYRNEATFRATLDQCAEMFAEPLEADIRNVLYPDGVWGNDEPLESKGIDFRALVTGGDGAPSSEEQQFLQTKFSQPIQFSVSVALAALWEEWGTEPDALIGHSIGEYAAAHLAGIFSLEDAVTLVAARSQSISDVKTGAMLAVMLPEHDVASILPDALDVAAVNTPMMTVVAGPESAIDGFDTRLKRESVGTRRLRTTHAFHSSMMTPAAETVVDVARRLTLRAPKVPIISTVTGTWMTGAQATDASYWARHLCESVRFAEGVNTLLAERPRLMLEVGPGQALGAWVRQHPASADRCEAVLSSLPHENDHQSDLPFMLKNLGRAWIAGIDVGTGDHLFDQEDRRRALLPTYPYERETFALSEASERDTMRSGGQTASAPRGVDTAAAEIEGPDVEAAMTGQSQPFERWFSVPVWKQLPPQVHAPNLADEAEAGQWLVLAPAHPEASAVVNILLDELQVAGVSLILVRPGEAFSVVDASTYTCRPHVRDDFDALLTRLRVQGKAPSHVVHAWTATPPADSTLADSPSRSSSTEADDDPETPFLGLLGLVQSLADLEQNTSIRLTVLTSGVYNVTGSEALDPVRATLAGPCIVASQEYGSLTTRLVDVDGRADGQEILSDCLHLGSETEAIHRNGRRWTRSFESVATASAGGDGAPGAVGSFESGVHPDGVYVITGGLGGIGSTLAADLASVAQEARLVLIGRSDPSEHDDAEKAERLTVLQHAAAEVLYRQADVTDTDQLREVVEETYRRFGRLDGVVHAAGVAPSGLMAVKEVDAARRVLKPKLQGTRHLFQAIDDVFGADTLDFFVLCSSLHAVAGGVGTVDHTAATAFQDAFAHWGRRLGAPLVSINWGGWADVGQAANAAYANRLRAKMGYASEDTTDATGVDIGHPLLRRLRHEDRDGAYRAVLNPDAHWVVDEHRVAGTPVFPGTASIDVLRAAASDHLGVDAISLRKLRFLRPVFAPDDQETSVDVTVDVGEEDENGALQCDLSLTVDDNSDPSVRAEAVAAPHRPGARDLAAVRETCSVRTLTLEAREVGSKTSLQLGPRWRHITQTIHVGAGRALAELRLDSHHRDDPLMKGLHPALLDSATGLMQALNEDVFLPLSYDQIDIYESLPETVFSLVEVDGSSPRAHAKEGAKGGDSGNSGELGSEASPPTLTCNVTLMDSDGAVLVRAKGYTMRRAGDALPLPAKPSQDASPTAESHASSRASANNATIAPPDGAAAFRRVLGAGLGAQVAVSPEPVSEFVRRIQMLGTDQIVERVRASSAVQHARPNLDTEFVAPRTDFEDEVAGLWCRALGIDRVGVHDNFFDLGGDSLLATQLVEDIAQTIGVGVSLRIVFDAPSIAEMTVKLVEAQLKESAADDPAEFFDNGSPANE